MNLSICISIFSSNVNVIVILNFCVNIFCRKYKASSLNVQSTGASNNVGKESKYPTGPKSMCTIEKKTAVALSYEELVQHKPLSCTGKMCGNYNKQILKN